MSRPAGLSASIVAPRGSQNAGQAPAQPGPDQPKDIVAFLLKAAVPADRPKEPAVRGSRVYEKGPLEV